MLCCHVTSGQHLNLSGPAVFQEDPEHSAREASGKEGRLESQPLGSGTQPLRGVISITAYSRAWSGSN